MADMLANTAVETPDSALMVGDTLNNVVNDEPGGDTAVRS